MILIEICNWSMQYFGKINKFYISSISGYNCCFLIFIQVGSLTIPHCYYYCPRTSSDSTYSTIYDMPYSLYCKKSCATKGDVNFLCLLSFHLLNIINNSNPLVKDFSFLRYISCPCTLFCPSLTNTSNKRHESLTNIIVPFVSKVAILMISIEFFILSPGVILQCFLNTPIPPLVPPQQV